MSIVERMIKYWEIRRKHKGTPFKKASEKISQKDRSSACREGHEETEEQIEKEMKEYFKDKQEE